jgi:hypothetical protein
MGAIYYAFDWFESLPEIGYSTVTAHGFSKLLQAFAMVLDTFLSFIALNHLKICESALHSSSR